MSNMELEKNQNMIKQRPYIFGYSAEIIKTQCVGVDHTSSPLYLCGLYIKSPAIF